MAKGWNVGSDLSTRLGTPLKRIETRIRLRRKMRPTCNRMIFLGNMTSTK
jgi:hypothetical protein